MTGEIFTQIALMIVGIASALVSAYLIPYIKSKANANDLEKLMEYARIAVRCANQIYKPEEWADKKKYVTNQAQAFILSNLKIQLSEEQIDTIIEGLVNEVKKMDQSSI